MHRKPSDNRVDVDDEEEKPRFKYQSMRGTVPLLLASDAASCIAVEKRMIALGTHGGFIYILDFIGNQVRKFSVHSATVNDLCFDIEGEYIGSCSDDGSVVINSLFTDKIKKFEYHLPMKAIALDPDYKRKSSRRFVAGGLAGHLYFNTKKWMRNNEQVLHSGQGPIHAVKWRTSLIAWANDAGVMVHDTANDQCIAIERPRGSRCPELLLPHLVWQDDTLLVIGWGTSIKIASIKTNQNKGANGTYGHISMSSMYRVDIVASFQTNYFISGVAPFGDFLVVLAYILGEDGDMEFCSTIPSRQGNAQRPELHVVTWNNDELATDALPVHGFEHYKAKDYSLAHAPFSGSSYAGGQWAAGDEPLYYVVSPKDVVIAEPRFTVAAVCCDEISKKKLSSFASNEEWCQLDEAVQIQPVSGFGKKLSSILATCLSEYDMEATCFNEGVRSAKRQQLEEKLLQLVQSAHQSMLGHIWLRTLDRFKEAFDKALNGGEVFSVAAHDCSESFMIQFDEGCADAIIQQATWDSSKMREKFQRDIDVHVAAVCGAKLSELTALYEKKLNEALLGPVDALLDGAGKDAWPAIRKLLCVETKSAVSGLSAELSSFDMDEQTKDKMLKSLGDYARGIVKSKEKEEAGRVLLRMKDRYRFPTLFSHDSDSMPRIWSGNEVIRAITKMARSASLKLLSVMAAIRLDDDTDNIEKTLVAALVDTRNGVATNKSITSADSLALSTWEEVPLSKTLITPAQFKSLWRQLVREYSVTQAISAQEASQRSNNWLPPPWAILALVVLSGFMTRNLLYLGPIFVAFLLVKVLWVQLDICGEFWNGALPGLLSLSTKFLPIATSSTASSAVTSLENGTGYSSPSTHEKVEDAKDHISWLIQHGWHEKAFEAGQGQSELFDEVVSNYLDSLIVERKYAEAASLCPKLLRGSASLCQLPVLVPYMPTENPRLSNTDYEVALLVLATNPSFHKDLLSTVKSWPSVIYSALPVISAIEPQLNTLSMTDALKEALVELYVIDGQSEKAFSLYADLMKPFFIENHNLQDVIREKVVKLMMLACKHAVPLLTHHSDLVTPSVVVSQLLAAGNKCDSRYFLHLYLHSLFEANPDAGRDFRDIQVELYADFDPKMLLPFLRNSQHYTLEKAYEICVKRDLLREQAFILGRMGDSRQALAVIINKLEDIEDAKEFVRMQHDDELWEELIKQCFHKPEMVGVLLEHTVGNLDPLNIINIVPNGLEIPRLRDRLVKVITDYRTEISLRHGCNEILKADCVDLLIKYYKEARRAICLNNKEDDAHSESDDTRASQSIEKAPNVRTIEVKSKTRGGGRCCICFDPFSIQSVSIIVFFCCHAYHTTCLSDSTNLISGKKAVGATSRETTSNYDYDDSDVDDDNDDDDDDQRMHCILCTTAASLV